jgi:hypothetical protein
MRRAQEGSTARDRATARAERIGSAMEVWSSPDLRRLLESGRTRPVRSIPVLRAALTLLTGRRLASRGGVRAH